jgi:hypothetical protein
MTGSTCRISACRSSQERPIGGLSQAMPAPIETLPMDVLGSELMTKALAIAALILSVWMFRYEIVSPSNVRVFRLDRWTGTLDVCTLSADHPLPSGQSGFHCE